MAASRFSAPVDMDSTLGPEAPAPMRMIAPLPHIFSIWEIARLRAFFLSSCRVETAILHPCVGRYRRVRPGRVTGTAWSPYTEQTTELRVWEQVPKTGNLPNSSVR